MMNLSSPYTIRVIDSTLHVKFQSIVVADAFFANCADIQQCFETGQYTGKDLSMIYIDLCDTTWFDTLALCYLLMFVDQSKHRHSFDTCFFFEENRTPTGNQFIFYSFLQDNGFLTQMKSCGTVRNVDTVPEVKYSDIHKCVWPLQIFHNRIEIERSIELIKRQLRNELSSELNSYQLEHTISKVTYFLQETLDNAYKHGYEDSEEENPCALLIKRVRSSDSIDLKMYRSAYTEHTPYINISLFEEKQEYLEIYIADIGVGLRHSFLRNPDGKDAKITDENILEYILSNGQRSNKKISPSNSSRYGGLYDITAMFQEDEDKLGFKGDSRWFFDKKPQRINSAIPQHEYNGLVRGFAVIGSISWKKRHSGDYPLRHELLSIRTQNKDILYSEKNPWMKKNYCSNIKVQDYRFNSNKDPGGNIQTQVVFPTKYFVKDQIIDSLTDCTCDSVIVAGIHESEYKKYKSTLENLQLNIINSSFNRVIVITNTLFAHVFMRSKNQLVYSQPATSKYIKESIDNSISLSYLSFCLWKRVYDSEQLWSCLASENFMGYINAPITWNGHVLRGYLDFSQLCLISECRNLCIEQLIGFQLYHDSVYFRSLDRFTDEICEEANHLMDNSREGEVFWIGSVFVSGTSERKLSSEARNEENVFYFFKHADCQQKEQKICTFFEWATQAFRIDNWFDPKNYEGKNYSRVGNSSFVAVDGGDYWASKHYMHWEQTYYLQQEKTYQLLQKQFGAHPAILKMGHFDSVDHHDLFEIKVDSLVNTEVIASKIMQNDNMTSFDFLTIEFLRALVSIPRESSLGMHLKQDLPKRSLEILRKKYPNHAHTHQELAEKRGLVVYLNDYQTSKIIENIKPMFSDDLQQMIVPIIPIEKNYASSTLLISPLLLDALEKKMLTVREFNYENFDDDTVDVTLFIATTFTTRLQEELKHLMLRMGAAKVFILSVFDRQRLPYGSCRNPNSTAYARLDLPAVGFLNMCPICESLKSLKNLQESLRDKILIQRIDDICNSWEAVKSSDNHYGNGISIGHLDLPEDIKSALSKYQDIYKQGEIDIYTNLGLSLFTIECTVISLSLDFLDVCLTSESLDTTVKLLLVSAHILIFDHLQLSEKHFCRLMNLLCDLLDSQTKTSEFTALAIIAISGQSMVFQKYVQEHMVDRFMSGYSSKNNDALLLKLAIYQHLSQEKASVAGDYRRELQCYLKNEKNALELIYDLFLYTEIEYKQSHRQAFGQIIHTSLQMATETYLRAHQYTCKLKSIYQDDLLKPFFHDPELYSSKRDTVLKELQELELCLLNVKSNEDHCKARAKLTKLLDIVQTINKGLYLRTQKALNNQNISNWLTYCEKIAQKRFGKEGDVILKIINGYTCGSTQDPDVCPWFFAHADVTEEVINLIVDMMQRRSSKLRDFLQEDSKDSEAIYDGIILVAFREEYIELSFYNATKNTKSIQEIRKIKQSKSNRPSIITFQQFERSLSSNLDNKIVSCFEWNYVEDQYPNYLAKKNGLDEQEHLFCATVKIPYVDMGSSFGNL